MHAMIDCAKDGVCQTSTNQPTKGWDTLIMTLQEIQMFIDAVPSICHDTLCCMVSGSLVGVSNPSRNSSGVGESLNLGEQSPNFFEASV